VEQAFSEF